MEQDIRIRSADLEEIFADRRDVKFWKKEGPKHSYLFWVRAMVSKDKDAPPIERVQIPRSDSASTDLSVKERKDIYGLLARSFDMPTLELIKNLTDGSFSGALQCLNAQEGEKLILNMRDLDDEKILDVLEKEYTRIFLDTYMPFIPPYESIYMGEKHAMGKCARDVESFYRKVGLGVESGSDMPDHISHECEFVSILCEKELNELKESEKEKYRVMREEFLRNHLLPWGPVFCRDLGALAKTDFYKGISLIGKEFFEREHGVHCSI